MNHRFQSTDERERTKPPLFDRCATSHPDSKASRTRRLVGELWRGINFSGVGLLLGSAPLFFGTVPLGIALLSASSSYTWWIAAGAVLGAFFVPRGLTSWAWVGVYAFLIILRLCIRFFVDPPSRPDGRPLRARVYLSLCWSSFRRNIGLGLDDEACGQAESIPLPGYRTPEMQLFGEHPFLRMLTAAVAGFVAGLLGMLAGGFHVYDLLGTLFLLVACPILTFLLVSVFGEAGLTLLFSPAPIRDMSPSKPGKHASSHAPDSGLTSHFRLLPLLSVLCLLACTVFAARGRSLLPTLPFLRINLSLLLALLFSLLASARLGPIAGLSVAVVTGLSFSPLHAPILILATGGFALLRVLSPRAGLLGGCAVSTIWCVSVDGVGTFVSLLPAIIVAIPIFLLIERIMVALPLTPTRAHADREVEGFTASVSAALTAESRAEAQRMRMMALSEALSSLSRRFSELSGQFRRPRPHDVRRICDEALDARCARCRNFSECHRREHQRLRETGASLASTLEEHARVTMEDFPAFFFEFCPNAAEIAADINARYARLRESLDRGERSDTFAADYAAMAALLEDVLETDRPEADTLHANRRIADRIYDQLTERGLILHGVAVTGREESGRRQVILQGHAFSDKLEETERLRALLEEICDTSLALPVAESTEHGDTILTFSPRARLRTTYAGSTVPAHHPKDLPLPAPLTHRTPTGSYTPPTVCGDHIALFHNSDGFFYALISDGMGSGEEASVTSDICVSFLEKMLASGGRAEVSLRMLDNYLHAKNAGTGGECSATVDLLELDLMDGHAVFAKNGAAPTYVVRNGTVYKLRSRSLPLGILRDTPPELLCFRTDPGDVVVMVSDGITQGQDECPWLIDLLSAVQPRSMDELRRDIIRRALSAGSEDDLSAIAIRVNRAP